jgi:hypothetical protein
MSEKAIEKLYNKYNRMTLKELKEARIMMFKMLTMEKNSEFQDKSSIEKYERRYNILSSLIREKKEVNNG